MLRDGSHEDRCVGRTFDNHDMVSDQHVYWPWEQGTMRSHRTRCCRMFYFRIDICIWLSFAQQRWCPGSSWTSVSPVLVVLLTIWNTAFITTSTTTNEYDNIQCYSKNLSTVSFLRCRGRLQGSKQIWHQGLAIPNFSLSSYWNKESQVLNWYKACKLNVTPIHPVRD